MLTQLSISDFAAKLASDEPAPGGGSAAALAGLTGAGLTEMVINLTLGRSEFAEHASLLTEKHSQLAKLHMELELLVDRDAAAFNAVVAAFKMPQGGPDEPKRQTAIQAAMIEAAEVPLAVAQASLAVLEIAKVLLGKVNPHAISDLLVGALASHTGVVGALLNTTINLPEIKDEAKVKAFRGQVGVLHDAANRLIAFIQDYVYQESTFAIMRPSGQN